MALQAAQHGQYRGREVAGGVAAAVFPGNEVDGDLGVGVAGELDAVGLQFLPQNGIVLDDPVVDHRDFARGVAMWVGIAIGGTAVSGPAGVPQPSVAAQGDGVTALQCLTEVGQPAGAAVHRHLAGAVENRDAGRVVTAVLHPAQGLDHHVAGRTGSDVADDSAHRGSG